MKKVMLWMSTVVILALAGIQTSCVTLTPAQKQATIELQKEAADISNRAAKVKEQIEKISVVIAAIQKQVEEKKIDPAAAVGAIKEVLAQKNELLATKDEILETGKRINAALDKAKEAGTPWYAYLLSALSAIGAIGGGLLGTNKYGVVVNKYNKAITAVGNVSRAYDEAKADPKYIAAEITNTPGMDSEYMRGLHHAALDKEI